MESNIGIDSKPRARRGRRRFTDRLAALAGDRSDDISDSADTDVALNVRVKERENSGKKGRIGSIFKDTSSSSIKGLFSKEPSHDLKDTIKRPLTGLFRRPGSRAGSREPLKNETKTESDSAAPQTLFSNYANDQDVSRFSELPHIEEQVLHDVANAPSMNASRIAAMYQLDFMNPKTAALAKLDDIDLSLLSRFLCLEEEVKDEEVTWTWDYVFASVSSEMREEWAQEEDHEDSSYEDDHRLK